MSAFFFGSSEKPLYGYYHPAESAERGQVLICQPWGVEYELAHRTLRFLARRLASRGWHVLRFDYRGTGDSWGDTTQGDLEGWAEDVLQAATELRATSGLEAIRVVGLRLGATLSALACRRLGAVERLVLWDPILNGSLWIEELTTLAGPTSPESTLQGRVELGRYTVSPVFRRQIMEIETGRTIIPDVETLVLRTHRPTDGMTWGEGKTANVEYLEQPSPWIEDVALGSGQIPIEAVSRIVAWMER